MVSADAVLQNTYEFKNKNGKSMKEDVSADVKSNYVQYHLKDDDSEVWVIDDFNRVSTISAPSADMICGSTSCSCRASVLGAESKLGLTMN